MMPITSPAIEDYLFHLASRYDEPVLKDFDVALLPLRDGVIVARRKVE